MSKKEAPRGVLLFLDWGSEILDDLHDFAADALLGFVCRCADVSGRKENVPVARF